MAEHQLGRDMAQAAGAEIVKRALRGNGQGFEAHDVFGAARQVHFTGDTMVVTPPFMVESIQPIWFCRGVQSPNTNTKQLS